jgi:superfamily II DNA or RNA helicase
MNTHITVSDKLTVTDAPRVVVNDLKKRFTLQNPKWLEAVKRNRRTYGIDRYLKFYSKEKCGRGRSCLILPRGAANEVIRLCRFYDRNTTFADELVSFDPIPIRFTGKLRPFQQEAAGKVMDRMFGVLCAPTGAGKTVIGIALIAERCQPTLILVHTKDLLLQWKERIEEFMGIPQSEIGQIGSGKKDWEGRHITVGIVNSVYRIPKEKIGSAFGHLLVDECHRAPSRTFTDAVAKFRPRYMTGLTATPVRRDGLAQLIFWYLGDLLHTVDRRTLMKNGDLVPAEAVIRNTTFRTKKDPSEEYGEVVKELIHDTERNRMIVGDVKEVSHKGVTSVVILTDRVEHCMILQEMMTESGIPSSVLHGRIKSEERSGIKEGIMTGEVSVLIATGQLIGEGFDAKKLSHLFVVTPIRFPGRITQYLGRVLRPAPGKKTAYIYDYADVKVGPLHNSAMYRQKTYESLGVRVCR